MRVSAALVIVLVILAGVFAVVRFGFERGDGEEALFPDFRPELAAKILLEGKEKMTILERTEDAWIVTSEDSFPSEAKAVQTIFDHLAGFSRKDIVSSNPEKQSLYQVDSTGVLVTIEDAGGKALASFIVGKVGPDYQSTYVRGGGSDEVVLAAGYLPPAFDRGKRSWQDKTIFSLEPADMVEVGISRPAERFSLVRDRAGQWYISQPESIACDQNTVTRLVRILAYLRCDELAGRAPVPESGLAQADSSVWLKTAGGSEERLLFGNETESKQIYAAREGSNMVYLLASHRVEAMLPGLEELRSKEVQADEE